MVVGSNPAGGAIFSDRPAMRHARRFSLRIKRPRRTNRFSAGAGPDRAERYDAFGSTNRDAIDRAYPQPHRSMDSPILQSTPAARLSAELFEFASHAFEKRLEIVFEYARLQTDERYIVNDRVSFDRDAREPAR